jgi:uncharacterized protein YukE
MDDNHKRVLGSSLQIIERRLRQIRQDLQQSGEEADSVLQSTINDIDPETTRRITDAVTSMLDEINQTKELFNLEVDHKALRWHIITTLSEIWNILDDLKPEKVSRAFGQMSDEVQDAWRPHITRLSKMVDELDRELGRASLDSSGRRRDQSQESIRDNSTKADAGDSLMQQGAQSLAMCRRGQNPGRGRPNGA